MKLHYPAIFCSDEKGYTVKFPDMSGCITHGATLEEAFELAENAALAWLQAAINDGKTLPKPSEIKSITVNDRFTFVNYISLDIDSHLAKNNHKYIKKTVTIPSWLNALAEKETINFSQELQSALKRRLNLF